MRPNERRHAEKALDNARNVELYFRKRHKEVCKKLENCALVTVSDANEESGVLLTEASASENGSNNGVMEVHLQAQRGRTKRRRGRCQLLFLRPSRQTIHLLP